MKIGILADTHNQQDRTRRAVESLVSLGAEQLFHCGDLNTPEIVAICSATGLPFHFVFGNHDSDMTKLLQAAAEEHSADCWGWNGSKEILGIRIGMYHGHLQSERVQLLQQSPKLIFTGHSHEPADVCRDDVRFLNPGALHRAKTFTVATLDLPTCEIAWHEVDR